MCSSDGENYFLKCCTKGQELMGIAKEFSQYPYLLQRLWEQGFNSLCIESETLLMIIFVFIDLQLIKRCLYDSV